MIFFWAPFSFFRTQILWRGNVKSRRSWVLYNIILSSSYSSRGWRREWVGGLGGGLLGRGLGGGGGRQLGGGAGGRDVDAGVGGGCCGGRFGVELILTWGGGGRGGGGRGQGGGVGGRRGSWLRQQTCNRDCRGNVKNRNIKLENLPGTDTICVITI